MATLRELASLIHEKTRKIADAASLDYHVEMDIGEGKQLVPQKTSLNLLRILQEGLTNMIEHAQASRIDIRIALRSDQLFFELRDNGCGFEVEGKSNGYGLRNMSRRCREMGAELKIDSNPGEGTFLSLAFSLNQASEKTV